MKIRRSTQLKLVALFFAALTADPILCAYMVSNGPEWLLIGSGQAIVFSGFIFAFGCLMGLIIMANPNNEFTIVEDYEDARAVSDPKHEES